MKDITEITAVDLAQMFVDMARLESMRVGHRHGGTQGTGATPYDTGALQKTIRVTKGGSSFAQVGIGNEAIDYASYLEFCDTVRGGQPNLHKGFIEKLIIEYFPQYIANKYGVTVKVNITGGNQ